MSTRWWSRCSGVLLVAMLSACAAGQISGLVEEDWLKQAEAWSAPALPEGRPSGPVATWQDAAGAVDGKKDGKYAFHTAQEPNPWWQVDLGQAVPIARIVVCNRLDYAPGLHNADALRVLVSDDGKAWREVYDNRGKPFGGVSGAPPLEVAFAPGAVKARFVRLQVPSAQPVYFHLDEVEVYGPADAKENLARGRPADQSSVSQWSTAKPGAAGPGAKPPPGAAGPGAAPAAPSAPAKDAYPTDYFIERGRLLAADLRAMGVETAAAEAELAACEGALAAGGGGRDLYLRVRRTARRLAFSNPLLGFNRLLFVKRFTQDTYPDVCLNHMPWVSRPGGDICVLSNPFAEEACDEGRVRALINGRLGPGHVHGLDLWWEGTRVVFGYARTKSPEGPRNRGRGNNYSLRREEEPIHIFEMDLDGTGLRQLTHSKDWSDLDPAYLPNGNICFVSERCGCSLQCNEYDKDETSTNLYVMRPDGSGIRRLSVTKDGDYLPHTLDDGTIAYTRWEYQERGWAHIQSIWTVRPDGTGADALFKQHLNEPWALEEARSIPGSRRLAAIATGHHTLPAGPVCLVDPAVGMNDPAGIAIVTPGVRPPEGGMSGRPVPEGGVRDRGGLYMHPWPLSEKHFLVSYCYGKQTDPTGYALYLVDVFGTKELIYRDAAISSFGPVPLRPRPRPPILAEQVDLAKDHAVCAVSDAAHGSDGLDPGRVRYIRVAQRLAWPYDPVHGGWRYETDAKGRGVNWTPVRVLGDVPVEADGSAKFQVPADTALYFQLLDENRMELRRMRSFISFRPGEQRGCLGCHESREKAPPAGTGIAAHKRDPSPLVPPPWGARPLSFLRDVQPVFDRHCVGCHGGLKPAGGLDFSGGLTAGHNRAYDTLIQKRLVAFSNKNDDAKVTPPLAFGALRSRLMAVLGEEKHRGRARLGEEDRLRLTLWMDANAPYHDAFINKRPKAPPYDLAADRDLAAGMAAVHERRCAACHKPQEISRLDWIDLGDPARSLMLLAPLAKTAGGTARCKETTYSSAQDPDCRAVRALLEGAVRKARDSPRRDVAAIVKENRLRRLAGAAE